MCWIILIVTSLAPTPFVSFRAPSRWAKPPSLLSLVSSTSSDKNALSYSPVASLGFPIISCWILFASGTAMGMFGSPIGTMVLLKWNLFQLFSGVIKFWVNWQRHFEMSSHSGPEMERTDRLIQAWDQSCLHCSLTYQQGTQPCHDHCHMIHGNNPNVMLWHTWLLSSLPHSPIWKPQLTLSDTSCLWWISSSECLSRVSSTSNRNASPVSSPSFTEQDMLKC